MGNKEILEPPYLDSNKRNWWCCGSRRGPAEVQCPFCRQLQPNVRLPDNVLLLKR